MAVNLDRELESFISGENFEGFMPNESVFEARFKAEAAEIQSTFGASLESFRANAASRGVFASGPALQAEFRDVVAPAAVAVESARTRGALGFETLRLQQFNVAQQFKLRAVELALEKYLGEKAAAAAEKAGLFSAVGSVVGAGVGFALGGPPGAAVGSQVV